MSAQPPDLPTTAGTVPGRRDALTASDVHEAVSYRPITRYEITGGYLNLPGLTVHDPSPQPSDIPKEQS